MEDIAQLPVAAHHGGGQTGAVGQGDAHSLQIHTDQLLRAHFLCQRGGHVVPVAAVEELHPIDLLGPQRGKTGRRGQQVVLHFSFRDLFQRQLAGFQAPLFHGDEAEPDGRRAEGVFVQHPLHDLFQRGDVHAALPHDVPQELMQLRQIRFFRQLHHILTADARPHIPRRLVQVQREHCAVQAADAGAQFCQCPPDAHLIAAAGSAAGQHQRLLGGLVLRHPNRLLCAPNQICTKYNIFSGKFLSVFGTKSVV